MTYWKLWREVKCHGDCLLVNHKRLEYYSVRMICLLKTLCSLPVNPENCIVIELGLSPLRMCLFLIKNAVIMRMPCFDGNFNVTLVLNMTNLLDT